MVCVVRCVKRIMTKEVRPFYGFDEHNCYSHREFCCLRTSPDAQSGNIHHRTGISSNPRAFPQDRRLQRGFYATGRFTRTNGTNHGSYGRRKCTERDPFLAVPVLCHQARTWAGRHAHQDQGPSPEVAAGRSRRQTTTLVAPTAMHLTGQTELVDHHRNGPINRQADPRSMQLRGHQPDRRPRASYLLSPALDPRQTLGYPNGRSWPRCQGAGHAPMCWKGHAYCPPPKSSATR